MGKEGEVNNSHANTPGTPFCIPGGHLVDPATKWELVRATLTDDTKTGTWVQDDSGKWYRDPPARWRRTEDSHSSIVVCSDHLTRLEEE